MGAALLQGAHWDRPFRPARHTPHADRAPYANRTITSVRGLDAGVAHIVALYLPLGRRF